MRYMMMLRSDENFTDAGPPPKELFDRMAVLVAETAKQGKLVSSGGLRHSSSGAQVRLSKNGKITVTDGPFSEAKEVIGGFAIIEASSKTEAIEHATRFMELHRDTWKGWEGVSEIREMKAEPPQA
jgi:hypothetical protein